MLCRWLSKNPVIMKAIKFNAFMSLNSYYAYIQTHIFSLPQKISKQKCFFMFENSKDLIFQKIRNLKISILDNFSLSSGLLLWHCSRLCLQSLPRTLSMSKVSSCFAYSPVNTFCLYYSTFLPLLICLRFITIILKRHGLFHIQIMFRVWVFRISIDSKKILGVSEKSWIETVSSETDGLIRISVLWREENAAGPEAHDLILS